jgi:hypothetical protein
MQDLTVTKLVDMIREIVASIGIVASHALSMLHFSPEVTRLSGIMM